MAIDGEGSGSTRIRLNTADAPTARPDSEAEQLARTL